MMVDWWQFPPFWHRTKCFFCFGIQRVSDQPGSKSARRVRYPLKSWTEQYHKKILFTRCQKAKECYQSYAATMLLITSFRPVFCLFTPENMLCGGKLDAKSLPNLVGKVEANWRPTGSVLVEKWIWPDVKSATFLRSLWTGPMGTCRPSTFRPWSRHELPSWGICDSNKRLMN